MRKKMLRIRDKVGRYLKFKKSASGEKLFCIGSMAGMYRASHLRVSRKIGNGIFILLGLHPASGKLVFWKSVDGILKMDVRYRGNALQIFCKQHDGIWEVIDWYGGLAFGFYAFRLSEF